MEKKVVLISATPLNNKPEDLYYLIYLFQDVRNSALNIPNLQNFFGAHIKKYKLLINEKQKQVDINAIQDIFTDIRDRVVKDITIRRTRTDLLKNETYRKDLEEQGIQFPKVAQPLQMNID